MIEPSLAVRSGDLVIGKLILGCSIFAIERLREEVWEVEGEGGKEREKGTERKDSLSGHS